MAMSMTVNVTVTVTTMTSFSVLLDAEALLPVAGMSVIVITVAMVYDVFTIASMSVIIMVEILAVTTV